MLVAGGGGGVGTVVCYQPPCTPSDKKLGGGGTVKSCTLGEHHIFSAAGAESIWELHTLNVINS